MKVHSTKYWLTTDFLVITLCHFLIDEVYLLQFCAWAKSDGFVSRFQTQLLAAAAVVYCLLEFWYIYLCKYGEQVVFNGLVSFKVIHFVDFLRFGLRPKFRRKSLTLQKGRQINIFWFPSHCPKCRSIFLTPSWIRLVTPTYCQSWPVNDVSSNYWLLFVWFCFCFFMYMYTHSTVYVHMYICTHIAL